MSNQFRKLEEMRKEIAKTLHCRTNFAGTEFERKYIDEITKADVEGIVYMNLERYSLRDKAMNSLKGILRAALNFAYEQYWIADNLYLPLRRMDVKPDGIMIWREQVSVKRYGDMPEHWRIVEHTKTYKDRLFPRTDALNEFLRRLYAVLDKYYPKSIYLFPDDTELGVINNNTVYRLYYRICHNLGIKISREEIKGTHSFRRNATTDVVNRTEGNVILASQLFGNSPAVACKNYYVGVDTRAALTALNQRKFS